jgi:hypothetical protein
VASAIMPSRTRRLKYLIHPFLLWREHLPSASRWWIRTSIWVVVELDAVDCDGCLTQLLCDLHARVTAGIQMYFNERSDMRLHSFDTCYFRLYQGHGLPKWRVGGLQRCRSRE